jgi:hypothetical protein
MIPLSKLSSAALSPEVEERARQALRDHPECFWMRRPDLPLEGPADVHLIVRRLRQQGGIDAWRTASELEACL